MIQKTEDKTKIELLDDLGENLKKMSVISFPEAPKGNEENEGNQTLVPDQQYPPSQIF